MKINLPSIKSLYGRIFAIFWLTLFVVLVLLFVIQHNDPRNQRGLSYEENIKLQTFVENISLQLQDHQGTAQQKVKELLDSITLNDGVRLNFTNSSGVLISKPKEYMRRPLRNFATMADDHNSPQQRVYGHWMLYGPFLVNDGNEDLLMYISSRWHKVTPFFVSILDKPFMLLLLTMLVSTPLLLWLAWMLARPARRLEQAAERVAQGYFEVNDELNVGSQEFRQAGASFNQMVTAINDMVSGQQRLLSDISHELRSPLTRLRMANALAMRKQGESAELSRIDTEAERMEQMIVELLSLSRMQLNSHVTRGVYTLDELWSVLLEDAEFEAEQLGKQLISNSLPVANIEGNDLLLCSALENVVRNAIKYANKEIHINFSVEDNNLIVEVSDDGEGVPEEMLVNIFRPFYRVSSARDRQSGGTGLGLAITDTAMRQHNGSAIATTNSKGGLTVHLSFTIHTND